MAKKVALKIVNFFLVFSIFASFIVTNVSAQNLSYKIPNPSRYDSLEDIIAAAGSLIRPLFLLTFAAMLLFGAFLMLTSQGNEEKLQNSRKTMVAAVVGFIIAALAPTLVNIVTNFLGVEGF